MNKPFDVDIDNLLNDNLPEETHILDPQTIKTNASLYNSNKLCEMIICDRYFNFNQEISVICMEELSNRRLNGDTFDYETYIETESKKLPKLDFPIPDIRNLINKNFKK